MPRQEIDYKKVATAADTIKSRGIEPSLTELCKELGLVAALPEMSSLLEQWYHTQPEFQRQVNSPLYDNIRVDPKKFIEKQENLEKSVSLLRATLESTADGIMMVNGQGQVVDWNQKFVEMWRIPSHLMEAGPEHLSFEYILDQLADPQALISDVEFLYSHPDWQGELPALIFKDSRIFERFTQPQRIGNEIVGRVYSFRDVTHKRLAEDNLRIRERAIEASTHGVAIIDVLEPNQPILYVNDAFGKITGYSEDDIIGKNLKILQREDQDEVNQKRIELSIREEREESVEMESYRKNGERFWVSMSLAPVKDSLKKTRHYVCILHDITERREMEQQLVKQATHDFLTELPNRVLLMDRVEQAILMAHKQKKILAFMFLDVDQFKMVNDTLGHSIGDKLLMLLANRLLIATDEFDTVARLGGDEFVILLTDIHTEEDAKEVAQNILESCQKTFQVGDHRLQITASLGLSFYPKDGKDYETLMKAADLSMYHAKDSGRNTYQVYEAEMNSKMVNYMQIDNALRNALKNNELYLVYQPLIDLRKNRPVGFEALIRWQNPELGAVSPIDFIGIAEDSGLIVPIGRWVLEQACKQLVRWHRAGFKDLNMAVNISGRQFKQDELANMVQRALTESGLSPQHLELELTESLLVENVSEVVKIMHQLKDMGVRLVIDDFGTGYSSLSYLKQFPVDKLKIDRSFINEIVNNPNDAALAKAIIHLGHTLNLDVLAEGVENELQKAFIIEHGCDYAQGYLFKPPSRMDDATKFLEAAIGSSSKKGKKREC